MLRNPERDDDLPSSGAGDIELSRIHPGLLLRGPGVTRLRCCVLDLHSAPAQALCATRRQAVETEFYRWRGSFLPLVAHLRTRCERACVAAQFTSCDVGSPVSPPPPGCYPGAFSTGSTRAAWSSCPAPASTIVSRCGCVSCPTAPIANTSTRHSTSSIGPRGSREPTAGYLEGRRLAEGRGLAGGLEHGEPQVSVRVHLVAAADRESHRDVYEAAVPAPHYHFRPPGHRGMDGSVRQADAVDAVVGVRRDAAYGVAGIDVPKVQGQPGRREVLGDPLPEKDPDIAQSPVPRGVGRAEIMPDMVLPGAFRDHDDGVPLPPHQDAQVAQETGVTVEAERYLGDQHVVRVAVRQRGVTRDETGVTAHQPYQADAVRHGPGLDVRRPDKFSGFGKGRLEPEAVIDVRHVVVDRLGHADDRDGQLTLRDDVGDLQGSAH